MENLHFYQYIGGELVEGAGREIEVVCPGNDAPVATLRAADAHQAQQALEAAQAAFPVWSAMTVEERGEWIMRLHDALEEEQETLIRLLMKETGKLRVDASDEIYNLLHALPFCLETAKGYYDETIREVGDNCFNLVMRKPVGVVVGYLAWNFPLHNLSVKMSPILATGCTAVLKPATKTPLSTLYVAQIMKKIGFPAGVINFVTGPASEISPVLTESKIPAMLCLIGSSSAGRRLIRDSATSIKRFSLELGGNAPFIVTPNANLDEAVERCVWSQHYVASQDCTGVQRVIVHESQYESFLAKLMAAEGEVRFGTGDDENCNMPPMITKDSVARMESLVEDAVAKGGKVIFGGKRAENRKGNYFMPTYITNVTRDMRVFREEIFGPICAIMTYQTAEEALSIANDTEYGLTSYVWSHNTDEVQKLSEGLQFGTVNVNGGCDRVDTPHGGIKESGIGKDGGRLSMEEYFYHKNLRLKFTM